jgi:hypothetical protein
MPHFAQISCKFLRRSISQLARANCLMADDCCDRQSILSSSSYGQTKDDLRGLEWPDLTLHLARCSNLGTIPCMGPQGGRATRGSLNRAQPVGSLCFIFHPYFTEYVVLSWSSTPYRPTKPLLTPQPKTVLKMSPSRYLSTLAGNDPALVSLLRSSHSTVSIHGPDTDRLIL